MKRKLFMVQGVHSNLLLYIPFVFGVLMIPVITHGTAEVFGVGREFYFPILAFDIFIMMFLLRKLSPQHFVVIKNSEKEDLMVRGQFDGGNIKLGNELSVKSISSVDNAVEFLVNRDGVDSVFRITQKYFTKPLLETIPKIASDLQLINSEDLVKKYASDFPAMKFHDSKKSMLMRVVEKPSHNKIVLACGVVYLVASYIFRPYAG